jgi:hypothetical protein
MGETTKIYSIVPRSDVPCKILDLDVTRFINVQHYILRIIESEVRGWLQILLTPRSTSICFVVISTVLL